MMRDEFDYSAVALDMSVNGAYSRWIEDFVLGCSDISYVYGLAEELHEDQEYGNRPYMYHLNGVAANALKICLDILDPGDSGTTSAMRQAIIVSFLHDSVEDGKISDFDLMYRLQGNFGSSAKQIVDDVEMLTRKNGESYAGYIMKVCRNASIVAKIVKLADLRFNKMQNLFEMGNGKKHFKHMYDKYSFAEILVRRSVYGD